VKSKRLGTTVPATVLAAAASCVAAGPTSTRASGSLSPPPVDRDLAGRLVARIGTEMREVQSAHYLVLYDAGQVFAESRARLAERAYKAFHGTFTEMGFALRPIGHKLVVVVLRDKERYVRYAAQLGYNATQTDGFYSLDDNAVVLFDSLTDPSYQELSRQIDIQREGVRLRQDQLRRIKGGPATRVRLKQPGQPIRIVTRKQFARMLTADNRKLRELEQKLSELATRRNAAKTMHEAAHQLSVNTGVLPRSPHNPFWVSEGLACQFEINLTASARKRGAFNQQRLDDFRTARRERRLRPLGQLLTVSVSPGMPRAELLALYGQAWALFHYLRSDRPQELAAYLSSLGTHGDSSPSGPAARLSTFKAHFGPSLRQLQRDCVAAIEELE